MHRSITKMHRSIPESTIRDPSVFRVDADVTVDVAIVDVVVIVITVVVACWMSLRRRVFGDEFANELADDAKFQEKTDLNT